MELVTGWQYWWRTWSTWLVTAGSSIVMFAPELIEIWRSLPIEVQASFPVEWVRAFGLSLIIASVPAKIIRQKKLYEQTLYDQIAE